MADGSGVRAVPPLTVMGVGLLIGVAGAVGQVAGWESGFVVFIIGAAVALVGLLALMLRPY